MSTDLYTWDFRDPNEWLSRTARRELPPLIVTVAITGGVHGKEINPNHPETPQEQADQSYECYKLGASMVHIHARDAQDPSAPSVDPERYREINALVREKCPDIIINNTTSNKAMDTSEGKSAPLEEQLRSLDANPEVCSMNMGPLMGRLRLKERPPYRPHAISMEVTTPISFTSVETIAKITAKKGIKPEIEIWHHGQFPVLRYCIDQGLLKPPYWVQVVLGNGNGADATPKNLMHEMELAPKNTVLSVAGLMPYQTQMATMAILLGLNVRTGMEDNPYYDKGILCTGNAQLVERVIRIAGELGRDIATPKQARQIMGLSEKPSKY